MLCTCTWIQYVYKFCDFQILRTLEFNGFKWVLTVKKIKFSDDEFSFYDSEELFKSQHFTKETLSREFFEKFPECKDVSYFVIKSFTK